MEFWIKVFVQQKQSYRDQSVRLLGFRLWRLGSKSSSSETELRRSGSKSSCSGNNITEIGIWVIEI
jgi:hypothetical protein